LYIRARRVETPATVKTALSTLDKLWELPPLDTRESDRGYGEEFPDAMQAANARLQIASGFRYRYVWEGGEPDMEWLDTKRAWSREVRDRVRLGTPGMETELLCASAAEAGRWQSSTWEAWKAIRRRYPSAGPPTEAIWISDHLVKDALAWAEEAKEGILWFRHRALAERVAREGGFPLYGQGSDAGTADINKNPIICCMMAQRDGKNLQAWHKNWWAVPSGRAEAWEQLMGRTHRAGQLADEVWLDVPVCCSDDEKAMETAAAEEPGSQKLRMAARVGW
jgi:hypothetical protein